MMPVLHTGLRQFRLEQRQEPQLVVIPPRRRARIGAARSLRPVDRRGVPTTWQSTGETAEGRCRPYRRDAGEFRLQHQDSKRRAGDRLAAVAMTGTVGPCLKPSTGREQWLSGRARRPSADQGGIQAAARHFRRRSRMDDRNWTPVTTARTETSRHVAAYRVYPRPGAGRAMLLASRAADRTMEAAPFRGPARLIHEHSRDSLADVV